MAGTSLAHIADLVLNRPLLILPDKLSVIAQVLDGRIGIDASGLVPDLALPDASRFVGSNYDPEAEGQERYKPYKRTIDGVAIITIAGSLVNRGAWIGANSGLVSYEGIKHQVAAAAADPKVRSIVLDLHTPGGEAVGAFEAADVIRAAASVKSVIAVVNGVAASAGYALAAAATRIVTTPTGIAGSIGVVMLHADVTRKLDRDGITPTVFRAGARKVALNSFETPTPAIKAETQAEIDRFYDLFVASVAQGRKGLSADAIRATEARTYIGSDAVDVGLADEVGSFEAVLQSTRAPAGRRSLPKGHLSMSDDAKYTQADMDKVKTEAHAAGRAEGVTAGKAEGHDAGLSAGRAEGRAAALADVAAITGCDEAKGKQAQALALVQAGVSLDAAKTVLKASPGASSLEGRMQANQTAGLGHTGTSGGTAEAASWDGFVAAQNAAVKAGRA